VLAGVEAEQREVPGEQRHERRGPRSLAQPAQVLGRRRTEVEAVERAGGGPLGRPRPVRGQLQHLGAGELPGPVRERLVPAGRGALVLGPRVVGVLHGQRRKLGVPARHGGRVPLAHLVVQQVERPVVGQDVVQYQAQHVVVGSKAQQRSA
jgi:hypothetical protein